MNQTKIILISIGGATVLIALVLAFFIFGSLSGKGEDGEELDYLESEARRLTRMPVYPGPKALVDTKDNRKAYVEWTSNTLENASAGDCGFEATTPATFKAFINDEARRFMTLPGAADGHFVKGDFGFGFDEYIHKGRLPSAADLPRLQREWYDISTFLGMLADAGASSVTELRLLKEETPVEEQRSGKRKRGAKKDESEKPDITRFTVDFTASAAALVKVFNDIASNRRFVVAEEYSFLRSPDALADRLGEKTEKKAEQGGRRRRRGEAAKAQAEAETEAKNTGVVVDPASVADFRVSMKIAVYDFRTKLKPASGADGDKEVEK